jgi:hypothetical protein
VTPLAEQWHAILDAEAADWSHLGLELRLADTDRTEEAVVAAGPLNPWRRDDDYREGILRFRAARTAGYGAAAPLVAERMRLLDSRGIGGTLRVIRAVDAARLVSTQGPTF